jgi:hypothetical protein
MRAKAVWSLGQCAFPLMALGVERGFAVNWCLSMGDSRDG